MVNYNKNKYQMISQKYIIGVVDENMLRGDGPVDSNKFDQPIMML